MAGLKTTKFIIARAKRLLPAQIIGTAFVGISTLAALFYERQSTTSGTVAAFVIGSVLSAFLIPISAGSGSASYSPYPCNPVLWSLLGEWVANIIYARALFSRGTRVLAMIAASLAAFVLYHVWSAPHGWDATVPFEFVPSLARATAEFLVGVIVYRLYNSGRLNGLPSVRPELIFSIWFFICAIPRDRAHPLFEAATALVIAPLAIAMLVRTDKPMPSIYVRLGQLSYPLYTSHFAAMMIVSACIEHSGASHSILWAIPIVALALAIAATVNFLTTAKRPRSGTQVKSAISNITP